jgi:endonuclease YncB( thermonuclease family)
MLIRTKMALLILSMFYSSFPSFVRSEIIVGRPSVIDGDTLEIRSSRFRLEGIDAPEATQTCFDALNKGYRCGQIAALALQDFIGARVVTCEVTGIDRYKRKLAYCRVNEFDISEFMVREGLAMAFVRYSKVYVGQEDSARKQKKGIWAGRFQAPWEYRRCRWGGGGPACSEP